MALLLILQKAIEWLIVLICKCTTLNHVLRYTQTREWKFNDTLLRDGIRINFYSTYCLEVRNIEEAGFLVWRLLL